MSRRFNKLREEAENRDKESLASQDKHLPTHDSESGEEVPEELKAKKESKSPGEKLLPTHKSDASAEVPEDEKDAEKAAKQKASPELDGQAVADGAAKDGIQKKVKAESVNGEEEEEEELEESDSEEKEDEIDLDEEEEEEEEEEDELALDEEEEEKDKEEMEEHISALTAGQNLSEEFKSKAVIIFEAAVNERVTKIKGRLQEKAKTLVEKKLRKEVERIVDHVDDYLDYTIQEWVKANEVAIDTGLKIEVTESLANKIKAVLEEAGVEVPEDEEDIAHKKAEEAEELEKELDEALKINIQLKKEVESFKRERILVEASEDLADSEKERLKELVSNLGFENEETFKEKVETISEHYLKKPVKSGKSSNDVLLEQGGIEDIPENKSKDAMDIYAQAISRVSKTK